ncbi:adult cuticle protein 1-like [Episyrphus balteatus]|uniref:adult cuticle protein 1-like n=1 Tax=Episyrphus balteatus TaxID=286459 RepID=UPI0024861A4C|nr:adult cuticle protein 1-like [Episyrphus balteatus]
MTECGIKRFTICALVLCALCMTSNASVGPLAAVRFSPLLYSAVAYGPGIVPVNAPSDLPSRLHVYNAPLIVPVGLKTEATYTAKTPGSEHVASLPGHIQSASSINLEQAPGSKDSNSLPPSIAIHESPIPAALSLSISPYLIRAQIVVPTEATYVAKNLGVEHTAPLPGHTISATSLNLQPAPGSK